MRPSSIEIFYGTRQRYLASLLLSDAAAVVFRPVREADELNLPRK